ncbi:MAG: YigZ family protein [Firmicutes bacterium]|nr:YigZ family protein [Candidatus Fiminaster equi]
MFTILERNEITLVRDRSSFIGVLIHATSVESVKQYLLDIRKQYPKAKHYCYAYIVGNNKKCSDDGEPAKTAGRPLLELLEKKEMDEVLLIVVRYFGGVLLGASRLMSTYLETGVQVINSADIVTIENKFIYKMVLTYAEYDELQRMAKRWGFSIENAQYEDKISVDVLADEGFAEQLADAFPHAEIEVSGTKKNYRR